MEKKDPTNPTKTTDVKSQCVTTASLVIWVGQYILAGIVYSLAAFLTTIGLKKWWNKDKTKN